MLSEAHSTVHVLGRREGRLQQGYGKRIPYYSFLLFQPCLRFLVTNTSYDSGGEQADLQQRTTLNPGLSHTNGNGEGKREHTERYGEAMGTERRGGSGSGRTL